MSGNFSDIRNLHVKGLITLCCQNSETSQKFLSSGTDGTVYIWDEKCLTEGNPPQIKTIGDTTHSSLAWIDKDVYIGYTSTDLLTGVDKRMVGKCSIDDMESCSQIFSFSLEVTSIDASPTFLVAGGSDFTIKKINLKYRNEYDRIDASGEVLCVKIDPKDEVFAVTCCDGSLSLFHLQNNTRIVYLEKLFPSFAGIDADNPRHQITWSKDGQSLFVPVQGEVKILIRDGWKLSPNSFKGSGTELECFSITCISSCGHFLAASTSNKICIWNILDRSLISQTQYKRRGSNDTISSIIFSPFNSRHIILTDVNEGLCMLENAVPIRSIETAINHVSAENVLNSDEDDEDDADNIIKNHHRRIIDDDAEDDTMSADIGLIKRKYGFGEDNSNALEEFGFLPETNSNPGFASDPSLKNDLKYSSVTETAVISSYKPPTIPERFVSGASPIHLSQRYLKWNNYGVVRSFSGDNASSIEIEFHDSTIHPEIILDNGETDYCMADLSDCVVALANIPEAKGEQSELLVIHIASWDTNSRRWNTKLPIKDCAVDVLASHTVVAVITEQRNIRVFTLSGTQRHIISHPGPILTTSCFENKIAICSIVGGDFYEEMGKKTLKPQYQHSVTIYDVDDKAWYRNSSNTSNLAVPVCRKERLNWLGYTNKGHLVTMDSGYTVRLLAPGGFWLPIFEGEKEIKGMSDTLWPIGVIEGRQPQFRYLYCKGSKYPIIAVKMTPVIASWSLPFCAPESDKSKLEESLFLNELQQSVSLEGSKSDLMELASQHLQSVVKLFALACKAERETRASEIASMISSAKGIQMMCNYAAKLKKHTLVDKVASIGRKNISTNNYVPSESTQQDYNVPRRLSLKRKIGVLQNNTVLDAECDNYSSCEDDLAPNTNEILDETIESVNDCTQLPLQRLGHNPFKRSGSSTIDNSISMFDQMDLSFNNPRKKMKDIDDLRESTKKKQIKLSFGAETQQEKETGRSTAYSLWLSKNEESLRKSFSGEQENYPKYCAQQYRMIPASEKKEWKLRAESGSV